MRAGPAPAQITEYLAGESARQCGPCRNGLPTLALLLAELASNRVDDALVTEIRRVTGLVDGRGSCRHPDGTARMIRSALVAFAPTSRRTAVAHVNPLSTGGAPGSARASMSG